MQDAIIGNWAQESHVSAEHLQSLRDLNRRFLDLACGGLPMRACRPGGATLEAQRAAAANCPYALFDLRFEDTAYWRGRLRERGALAGRR